jgi:excisionase family DNA binding protein
MYSVLTVAQTAAMGNVSTRTVEIEVQRGNLRRLKFGRSVRFDEADVIAWLHGRGQETARQEAAA